MSGDAAGAQNRRLLEPLILGDNADEQLNDRDQSHHIEDGGDARIVGQIKEVALIARIAYVTDAGVVHAIASARAAQIVRRRKGTIYADAGRLAVARGAVHLDRIQRRLQRTLRATHQGVQAG